MDNILQGVPRVCCYIDDILVSGETDADHLKNLDMVLRKLEAHRITVFTVYCLIHRLITV